MTRCGGRLWSQCGRWRGRGWGWRCDMGETRYAELAAQALDADRRAANMMSEARRLTRYAERMRVTADMEPGAPAPIEGVVSRPEVRSVQVYRMRPGVYGVMVNDRRSEGLAVSDVHAAISRLADLAGGGQ